MIDDMIGNVVAKRREEQERLIKEAFLHHFGFPIDEVHDKSKLDRVIEQGSPVQRFRYCGQTFFIWDESDGFNVETGTNYCRLILNAKYLFV